MNWITKFIKPKIKSLFEKRSSKVETSLWTTCSCKNLIYSEDMNSNRKVCPKCGEHHKLTCEERFKTFFDNKEYEIIDRIKPVGGRFLFMSNQFHASQPPIKNETRMTLNYNLRKHG